MTKRREHIILAAWSVFIGIVWMGPALFGYAMHITDHDLALQYYPYFDFYAKALQSGQSFLWLPGIFSGFPVYLSQVAGFFDPINFLIFSYFSGIDGVHIRLFLDIVAVGVFSYLAARSFGISRTVSMLVGPSFLIAFHVRFLSNPIIANTLFLIPLLVYVANGVLDRSMIWWRVIVFLGIGTGIALLSGYTQIVVYAFLAVAIYAILRLTLERAESLRSIGAMAIPVVVGTVVGVVIGLPFVLPAAQFLPYTARAESPTYDQATKKVIEYGDLALYAVPDYFYIPYVTAGRKPLYVGALWGMLGFAALVFAVVAVFKRRSLVKNNSRLIAVSSVFLILIIAAIHYSPLFYLIHKLPILGEFRFPYRFMYVGTFFMALLGAYALDRWREMESEKSVRIFLTLLSTGYVVFAGILVFVNALGEVGSIALARGLHTFATSLHVYDALGMTKGTDHYAEAFVRALQAMRELLSFNDAAIFIPTLLLAASTCCVIAYIRRWIDAAQFRTIALSISFCTVIIVPIIHYRSFVPQALAGTAPHISLSFSTPEDARMYRMYSFIPSAAAGQVIPPQYKLSPVEEDAIKELNVKAGFTNYHLYHDLGSVDGYDQFESLDTLAALELIGGELGAGYGSGTTEERAARLLEHLDVLAMMGGKYIISGVELASKSLTLRSESRYTEYGIRLFVYEQEARPRYYVATDAVNRPHSGFRDLIKNGVPSFKKQTYMDCVDCARSARGDVQLVRSHNGFYELNVVLEMDGQVVLTESFIPGWVATIDEVDADIVRANGLYMALSVPAGYHRITFEYQGLMNELRVLKMLHLVE